MVYLWHVLYSRNLFAGQVMELTNKSDKIIDFAWEPKGHRFVIVHGDGEGPRYSVSFYTMRREKGKLGIAKHRGMFIQWLRSLKFLIQCMDLQSRCRVGLSSKLQD